MTDKIFIVVRGLPGSGKSTFAALIADWGRGVVFSTDDYWADKPFQAGLLGEAHRWNKGRTVEAFYREEPLVVLANTTSREWEFQEYINEAMAYGYKVFSVVTENRHGGETIHEVPEGVIRGMERTFQLKLYKETRDLMPLTFWGKVRSKVRRFLWPKRTTSK